MSREVTTKLLDKVEQGHINKDIMIRDLLGWMSEADVQEFALANDYVDEPEDEEDGDVDCIYCGQDCGGECDEALAGGFQDPS